MTEKEYRTHPAISRSELWRIAESPEKFKYYRENPEPPTPALLFGQLFHKMALEPDTVWEEFAVAPAIDRRTKDGKAAYAAFLTESEGKAILTQEDFARAREMCDALERNDFARKLLNGEREKPFFWLDDLTWEECKCRVDCLSEIGKDGKDLVIVDVKSAESAETEAFTRAAIKYGYDFQSAMYCEGVKVRTGREPLFVFIAVEKKPPYAVNILQADKLFIRRGYDAFRELLGVYHDCKQTGNFYGYLGRSNQINNLALPAWLAKEVE